MGKCILAGHPAESYSAEKILDVTLVDSIGGEEWTLPKRLFDYQRVYIRSAVVAEHTGYTISIVCGSDINTGFIITNPQSGVTTLAKFSPFIVGDEILLSDAMGVISTSYNSDKLHLKVTDSAGKVNGTIVIYAR